MFDFDYYSPTKVVFGKESLTKVAEKIKQFNGHRVLVHYGNFAKKSGLVDRITAELKKANIQFIELGGVVSNPHLSKVYEGIDLARRNKIDFILAIGGGSVIDSSKTIAYGLANPENDVWDFFIKKAQAKACYPVGVVLTIAASGSETSNGCVITNEKNKEKRSYDTDLARPKFAIMDPELTMTLPDYQTEAGAVDMMMHTMERYFTQGGNMEITDAIAESVMRVIKKNAIILHTDPQNYDARAELMWSASVSHNGLTQLGTDGGDWSTHRLEHELSGMFNVTHGAGLAAIWPSWARYVYQDNLPRFVKFVKNVLKVRAEGNDREIALAGIHQMEEFYHTIGMPINIKELGVSANK